MYHGTNYLINSETTLKPQWQANMQNTMLNVSKAERKTLADRFHDALSAASVNDEAPLFSVPKPSG